MLRSVDSLTTEISGPLTSRLGPKAKILTAEVHGDEVRGLALCPGKVIRYVFAAQTPTAAYQSSVVANSLHT